MKTLIQSASSLLLLTLALNLCGCSTVAQKINVQTQASLDSVPDAKGNYQNSGVLSFTNHIAIITETARARYNFLIRTRGARLAIDPPIKFDDGLTPCDSNTLARYHAANLWFMDKLHLQYWTTMNTFAMMPDIKKN